MLYLRQSPCRGFIDAFPRLNQFQMGPEERNGMKQNQCGKRNEQNFEQKIGVEPVRAEPDGFNSSAPRGP
jgi:hypothetical protein